MPYRAGIGFDAHRLELGRPLFLGGVRVPHSHGLLGHSDGDVLVHAIMDALLGAAGAGDKGTHFPSDDPSTEGAQSIDLLRCVAGIVADAGWRIQNVDATMLAQKPTLAPYLEAMKKEIGSALSIPVGVVSIKPTTTDQLGFVGRQEGMAAYAVAMLDTAE